MSNVQGKTNKRLSTVEIDQMVELHQRHPEWPMTYIAQYTNHNIETVRKYLKKYGGPSKRKMAEVIKEYLPENPTKAQELAVELAVKAMFNGEQWAITWFMRNPTGKTPDREAKSGEDHDALAGAFGG
jgi:hypothetical protein